MQSDPIAATTNLVLASLSHKDRQRFFSGCETVELISSVILSRRGDRIEHVYFPTESYISVIAPIDGHAGLEVGLIGNEGMLGMSLALGVKHSPFDALVQGDGIALRMRSAIFLKELEKSLRLRRTLQSYIHTLMEQLAQTTVCSHFHLVEARLARWLLMTRDRAHTSELHITHAFLAYMLGVRRVGITNAAMALQQRNLIRYHRGVIEILDGKGLQSASCACYETDKTTYARNMG